MGVIYTGGLQDLCKWGIYYFSTGRLWIFCLESFSITVARFYWPHPLLGPYSATVGPLHSTTQLHLYGLHRCSFLSQVIIHTADKHFRHQCYPGIIKATPYNRPAHICDKVGHTCTQVRVEYGEVFLKQTVFLRADASMASENTPCE